LVTSSLTMSSAIPHPGSALCATSRARPTSTGSRPSERANLNYWAFWTGDFDEQQTCDAFISSTPLSAWHGDRLMRHLLDRLHGNIGFLELNIHTLWSLIQVRPEMIRDTPAAGELQVKLERLLDENLVSMAARSELDALRYGIAMARRY
jgi:hypothetical protein